MSEDGKEERTPFLILSMGFVGWDSWALEAEVGVLTPVLWEAIRSWPVHDTEWFLVGMYVVYRSLSRHEVLCINKW